MAILLQKGDLSNVFTNNNTNNAGGISVRAATDTLAGIDVKTRLVANPNGSFTFINSTTPADNVIIPAPSSPVVATVQVFANDGTTLLGYLVNP